MVRFRYRMIKWNNTRACMYARKDVVRVLGELGIGFKEEGMVITTDPVQCKDAVDAATERMRIETRFRGIHPKLPYQFELLI